VPNPYLAQQITQHIRTLTADPSLYSLLSPTSPGVDEAVLPDAPIIIATDLVLSSYSLANLPSLTHIFLDEPDDMLGPLPTKFLPLHLLPEHPINSRPPRIISIMNRLLHLRPAEDGTMHGGSLNMDFTSRREGVSTIWTSATLSPLLRRFVKTRGWLRRDEQEVDLDFTETASPRQQRVRREIVQMARTGDLPTSTLVTSMPEQYAFTVSEPMGRLAPLSWVPSRAPDTSVIGRSKRPSVEALCSPLLVEALALLHSTSPPPKDQYALALAPESSSFTDITDILDSLQVPYLNLTPEILVDGIPDTSELPVPPVLLTRRSAVPGLHLPGLHTVYLLSGLDMAGLSPAQKRRRGEAQRVSFYETVCGRLGRLGTENTKEAPQRVISLVMEGGVEEAGLRDLFFGKLSRGRGRDASQELDVWKGEL
jgi:hypothetical protein